MNAPAWLHRPAQLVLGDGPHADPGAIEVWRIDLDDATVDAAAVAAGITHAEGARAARFRFERDRRRYVISHAALRSILAGRTGIAPLDLPLEVDDAGKPHFTDPALPAFNLTHAGELALLAIAPPDHGRGLGVDTERTDRARIDEYLLQGSVSPAERSVWSDLPDDVRARWFFLLWTRKEAAIKADGRGLGIDPTGMAAFDNGDASPWEWGAIDIPDAATHGVVSFVPREGYLASVCTRPGRFEVRGRRWRPGGA